MFLAWHSEQRTKSTTKSYDEWLEDVVGVGESGKDPK
jgi:hypothetical protein